MAHSLLETACHKNSPERHSRETQVLKDFNLQGPETMGYDPSAGQKGDVT